MIGLRQLSHNRSELYASHFPLDILKPYLLKDYREAFATIVLYEDNIEVFHETGIFSFDASEPETFNYEEFRAPLIEEFHDRLAICTVENLFLHLEHYMEEKPMEDDPFVNLVFSISLTPPSREVLEDWSRNIDQRLQRVLYDVESSEHFQLFPNEVCVVYSHDNYYTSVTSDREDLIYTMFEDLVEQYLAPITAPPLPQPFVQSLFELTKTQEVIRMKAERLHTDEEGQPFLLVTYPKQPFSQRKKMSRIYLNETGTPMAITPIETLPRLLYLWRYTDLSFTPIILTLALMTAVVGVAFFLRILLHAPKL